MHVCILQNKSTSRVRRLPMSVKSQLVRRKESRAVAVRSSPRSRQKERTEATRRKLLAAAETIFARDGFEAARLEDIAAEAGYTRGAFYANFKSKEDIFFALLDAWIAERMAEVYALIEKYDTPRQRLDALRDMYAEFAQNRRLALLSLEFKLYAIRHPRAQTRLRARNKSMRCNKEEIWNRINPGTKHNALVSNPAIGTALGAFSHALLVEHLVDPATMPSEEIQRLLKASFEMVLTARER
jgi:AcrR family transcriptional regulator